jgi:hypothetical protein
MQYLPTKRNVQKRDRKTKEKLIGRQKGTWKKQCLAALLATFNFLRPKHTKAKMSVVVAKRPKYQK